MRSIVRAVLCGALALSGAALGADDESLPPGREYQFEGEELSRAMKAQGEFQEAGRTLAETHAAALKKPDLQKPLQDLAGAMEREMIRLAPERKAEIEMRYAVYREMVSLEKIEQPTQAHKDRYRDLLREYRNVTEALGDLPEQAMKAPPVVAEREKFHTKLLAVMTAIEPKVPELMKQQQVSIGEVRELERDLLKKHTAGDAAD